MSAGEFNIGGYTQDGLFDENTYPTCTCPDYRYGERIKIFGGRRHPAFCIHILQALESRTPKRTT